MKISYLLPLLFLFSCSKTEKGRSYASIFPELPSPELGEVWDAKAEEEAQKILDLTLKMLKKSSERDDFVRRDAHPKAHGCVKAFVNFDITNLHVNNRTGIFSKKAQYQAWIRFSNGAQDGAKKHDLEKDVRGMAIKLLNVDGTPTGVHDILLASNKEFFSKDASDYLSLVKAIMTGSILRFAHFGVLNPLSAKRLFEARIQTGNVLKQDYHSSVSYKLGPHSARFSALSCDRDREALPEENSDPNFLRKRLASSLEKEEYCFDFFVQPNKNPGKQDVEDPRLKWDEKNSPLVKVGRIRIPKQKGIDEERQQNFCENIEFNPWHSMLENRPLGQINRVRFLVYEEISKFRHGKNRTPRVEPVNHHPCSYGDQNLCDDPK